MATEGKVPTVLFRKELLINYRIVKCWCNAMDNWNFARIIPEPFSDMFVAINEPRNEEGVPILFPFWH